MDIGLQIANSSEKSLLVALREASFVGCPLEEP